MRLNEEDDEELWDLFMPGDPFTDDDPSEAIVFPKLFEQVKGEMLKPAADEVPCFSDLNGNPIPATQYENFPILVNENCHQYTRDHTQTPACWLWN